MLFSSYEFIFLFLPAVLFIYYVLLKWTRTGQNLFLTFASLCFYAWGEPSFVLVMIFSIICNWGLALLVDKLRESPFAIKLLLLLMAVINLSILGVFKYLMFIIENTNTFFSAGLSVPTILLPLGISFFTFQAISYVVDVYRRNGKAPKILVVQDSFGRVVTPYLALLFQEVDIVDPRYKKESVLEYVKRTKPDYTLYIILPLTIGETWYD